MAAKLESWQRNWAGAETRENESGKRRMA